MGELLESVKGVLTVSDFGGTDESKNERPWYTCAWVEGDNTFKTAVNNKRIYMLGLGDDKAMRKLLDKNINSRPKFTVTVSLLNLYSISPC